MSSFIPDSAPFNEEQRAWLNGFFSGLMGISPGADPSATLAAAGIPMQTAGEGVAVAEQEEDFPWHDSALPIVDRMAMAEGKPVERKLMAAMAQLDCGTCGYVCQSYAEAIASGEETNLTLCSPGGKETKKAIKEILKERGEPTTDASKKTPESNGSTAGSGKWTRKNPFPAPLVESRPLNGPGSAKDTRHVVIDLKGSDLTYSVGDALGVFPTNCRELAASIVNRLAADPELVVETASGSKTTLIEAITEQYCLKDPSDELLELLAQRTKSSGAKDHLSQLIDDGAPDGVDVLDVLDIAENAPVTATEFLETLAPMNPRLYSIASSMKHVGDSVHLTVGKVSYDREGRTRKGVASTMLADRLTDGDSVRVFVQPNHGGFTTPQDPNAPMIMVGPGTGIAPFLAFLQQRQADQCPGKNWLFFGDQHAECDFLYRNELGEFLDSGTLTRLDTAFSRDGDAKVYVQHRMREHAAEMWQWLENGAYFFVCGDASRMAADVDLALTEIVSEHGNMSSQEAKAYVASLRQANRYVRDVY